MTETAERSNELRASAREESPVARVVSVHVPAARVRKAFEGAYRELAKSARVKGFRPGKTPRSVLERLYGPAIAEDVESRLVAETLQEAVDSVGIVPVAEPSIDAKPPSPDADFAYSARIEVKPAIALPDLGGLKGQRPKVAVEDAEIDSELESLRVRRAPLVDEPAGTPIADGHFVTLDSVGRIGGEAFPGGTAQGATLQVGSGLYPEGFESGLVGLVAGDDREIAATLPDDPSWGEAAGQAATFSVHVVAVKRRELPALDDALAKDVGGFESLGALRDRIRADLTAIKERDSRGRLRASLMEGLLARVDFPVPPSLVTRRVQARLDMAHRELEGALPHDEIHARIDQWREEWRPSAERELREELLLEAIGEARGLAPDDEAVSARIDELARDQGVDARRLRKTYEDRGMRPALASALLRDRALDLVIAQAEIEEVAGV
ncbi:MAG TPA: trigger factor [Myxococcota bacterium]|nr:trigger factor [Myxococcota bacterium]